MWILGLNTGLNSSTVLLKNDEVIYGIQEERLSREKNQPGFPTMAISAALKYAGIQSEHIDKVCIGGKSSRIINSRQEDLQKYHDRYEVIKEKWFKKRTYIDKWLFVKQFENLFSKRADHCPRNLEDYLAEYSFTSRHTRYDHHTCHAASAYYGLAPEMADEYLVFTMDGGGDRKTSCVFLAKDGRLEELASSFSMSLASLYAHVTYILGFLPHEHEYKLMGLAPYAGEKYAQEICEKLYKLVGFSEEDPMVITNTNRYKNLGQANGPNKVTWIEDLYREVLDYRFDSIAAGLQLFVQKMALEWVTTAMNITGINKVLLSGGFFMNVKVNQLIAELPSVEYINCFPSCGDESNAFGAAFLGYRESQPSVDGQRVRFSNFCVGPEPQPDLANLEHTYSDQLIFRGVENVNEILVDLLCENKIVARCSGRMEFGARALGNRSILAAPNDPRVVQKINHAIKMRDFWMPFAPAVLVEYAEQLLDMPESLKLPWSPYMMFTFPVKSEEVENLVATTHQADGSARAQIVDSSLYPEVHDIITQYYERTGIPALLNTSFNLHGYPIVSSAKEAIEVFLQSELDVLIIENVVVVRR